MPEGFLDIYLPQRAAVNPMRIFPYIFLMTVLMVICGCAYPISQEMKAKARQEGDTLKRSCLYRTQAFIPKEFKDLSKDE
jgi:hypothetical protein